MRVAAAQTAPVWGDPQATADVVVEWVRKAAADDVDLDPAGHYFRGDVIEMHVDRTRRNPALFIE